MGSNAQIFISYAREDEEIVKSIYSRLAEKGFNPWMDTVNILPGEKWEYVIEKQIRNSGLVLICLSKHFSQKRGFLQRELKIALDTLQEMIAGDIFIIPARLENCDVPDSLKPLQWVDLFEEKNWDMLFNAIKEGAKRRNINLPNAMTDNNQANTYPAEMKLKKEFNEINSSAEEEKYEGENLFQDYKTGFKSTPLQGWLSKLINQHECKILIYGQSSCGKTSFIQRINYLKTPKVSSSTKTVDIYQSTFTFRARDTSPIKISFADYMGNSPSQILVDPPESFFGSKKNRSVNFLYFMVDLFPPRFEAEFLTNKPVSEREILKQINSRVRQNLEYVSKFTIEPVLRTSYSERNFLGIKLIINKIDILDNLISLGYLSDSIDTMELYQPLVKELRVASTQKKISDNFSVHAISAKTNAGVQKLLVETIENYFNSIL